MNTIKGSASVYVVLGMSLTGPLLHSISTVIDVREFQFLMLLILKIVTFFPLLCIECAMKYDL